MLIHWAVAFAAVVHDGLHWLETYVSLMSGASIGIVEDVADRDISIKIMISIFISTDRISAKYFSLGISVILSGFNGTDTGGTRIFTWSAMPSLFLGDI